MKIKIKEANLYNCEGFMTDSELVDKINTAFKTGNSHNTKEDGETIMGMTLHDLIQIQPRDFFTPTGDGETLFAKLEVNRIIKYLNAFDLTLNKMVTTNKYKRLLYSEEPVLIEKTNIEVDEKPKVEYGREPTDAEVDKAFEDAEAFQPNVQDQKGSKLYMTIPQ